MRSKVEDIVVGGRRIVKRFLFLEKTLKCADGTLEWRWLETAYILQRYSLRHNIDMYWRDVCWATCKEYEKYRKTGRMSC